VSPFELLGPLHVVRGQAEVPVLHGVRGLAALLVFVSHAANVCFGGAYLGNGGGQLGVMLFFMLSGYLMAMLYLRRTPDSGQLAGFAVNRLARIYPMFALAVIANYVIFHVAPRFGTYGVRTVSDLVEHLLFIKGYSVFWTIGPEVVFYGLFLLLWVARSRSATAFSIVLAAMLLASLVPGMPVRDNSILALHHRLPYFLVGMVLGLFHERWRNARPALSQVSFYGCLLLLVFSFPQLVALWIRLPPDMLADPSSAMWMHPFYLALCAALLLAALAASPWLLTNRTAVFMGKISFSFYLLHVMVLINLHAAFPGHPWSVIATALLLTAALSWLCYASVESPCRRWLRSRLGTVRTRLEKAAPAA
jgi:peptidoglycan/LPS O-acetylase OafA/YrhL